MKSSCEKCACLLSADAEAYICSFECTFCPQCAASGRSVCPHCGGELVRRPRRNRSVELERPLATTAWIGPRPALVWAISLGVWSFVTLAATVTIYKLYSATE